VAVLGIGFLLRDKLSSLTGGILSLEPTDTPNMLNRSVTSTPSSLSPMYSPSPTSTSTPSEIESMSEDEKRVREFLEKDWVEAFNSNNLDRMLSLYTEDVTLFSEPSYSYSGLRGDHSLSWHYSYNFSNHWRIVYYRIATVNISDNKAEALSYVTVDKGPGTTMGLSEYSQYKLRKITEITKGRITTSFQNLFGEYMMSMMPGHINT